MRSESVLTGSEPARVREQRGESTVFEERGSSRAGELARLVEEDVAAVHVLRAAARLGRGAEELLEGHRLQSLHSTIHTPHKLHLLGGVESFSWSTSKAKIKSRESGK